MPERHPPGRTYATVTGRPRRADEIASVPDELDMMLAHGNGPGTERVYEITFRDTLTKMEIGVNKRFDYSPGVMVLESGQEVSSSRIRYHQSGPLESTEW